MFRAKVSKILPNLNSSHQEMLINLAVNHTSRMIRARRPSVLFSSQLGGRGLKIKNKVTA